MFSLVLFLLVLRFFFHKKGKYRECFLLSVFRFCSLIFLLSINLLIYWICCDGLDEQKVSNHIHFLTNYALTKSAVWISFLRLMNRSEWSTVRPKCEKPKNGQIWNYSMNHYSKHSHLYVDTIDSCFIYFSLLFACFCRFFLFFGVFSS